MAAVPTPVEPGPVTVTDIAPTFTVVETLSGSPPAGKAVAVGR